jgi:uncharacterized membrane protein
MFLRSHPISLPATQIVMGAIALLIATRKGPITGRNGYLYENQTFMRWSLVVIGIVLVCGGVWSLWLLWRLPN